jgi:16S rRNA (uracil1498-N3)-methyltransferase
MLEKATELGVERIQPIIATRSERGLDQAAGKRIERWRRIAMEASQQSRRDRVPVVELPVKLGAALGAKGVLLDEDGGAPLLRALPETKQPGDEVVLALGPEGGWTPEERSQFVNSQWTRATLGPQILRAETAAIAGLSIVNAAWSLAASVQS